MILLPLILLESLSRGFNFRGYTKPVYWKGMNLFKWLDHLFTGLLVASFFGYALYFALHLNGFNPYWKLGQNILVYVLLRVALFNYVHNLAAGLPLKHLGKVSWVDRILVVISMGNFAYYVALQAVALFVAVQITFKIVKI